MVNAVWDLYAKVERKPVGSCSPNVATPDCRLHRLRYIATHHTEQRSTSSSGRRRRKAAREAELLKSGIPRTPPPWMVRLFDDRIQRLFTKRSGGVDALKVKVGGRSRRQAPCRTRRHEIGPDCRLRSTESAMGRRRAIRRVRSLSEFDLCGDGGAPARTTCWGMRQSRKALRVRVATGEHCANRVIFKQLMQANAIGVCQIDACASAA